MSQAHQYDDGTQDFRDGTASVWSWPLRLAGFVLWYLWALVTSSGAVLHDLITPSCRTDLEVTVLSSLITLTPGTLTLGTRRAGAVGDEPGDPEARRLLYVHGLYFDDADGLRADIHDMERRMLHALRRTGVAA